MSGTTTESGAGVAKTSEAIVDPAHDAETMKVPVSNVKHDAPPPAGAKDDVPTAGVEPRIVRKAKSKTSLICNLATFSMLLTGIGSILTGVANIVDFIPGDNDNSIIVGTVFTGLGTIVTLMSKALDEYMGSIDVQDGRTVAKALNVATKTLGPAAAKTPVPSPKPWNEIVFTLALLSALLTGTGSIVSGLSKYIMNTSAAVISGAVLSGVGTGVTLISKVTDERDASKIKDAVADAITELLKIIREARGKAKLEQLGVFKTMADVDVEADNEENVANNLILGMLVHSQDYEYVPK